MAYIQRGSGGISRHDYEPPYLPIKGSPITTLTIMLVLPEMIALELKALKFSNSHAIPAPDIVYLNKENTNIS